MKKASGINYIILAVLAFASLGLEVLLAFGIEPLLYGAPMNGLDGFAEYPSLDNHLYLMGRCKLVHGSICKEELSF